MRKLLTLTLTVVLVVIGMPYAFADCTISGTVNVNTNPFCSGVNTITGTLVLNNSYTIPNGLGAVTLMVDGGKISFNGPGIIDFNLPDGSSIVLINGGTIDQDGPANSCSSNKSVFIGGDRLATCNGGGGPGNYFSFSEVNEAGGLSQNGLLPVELTAFEAYQEGQGVRLQWITASEFDNNYFEIQHSTDDTGFRAIDRITGNGTTHTEHVYEYYHHTPSPGNNYYRLKQVDYSGEYAFTDIRVVRLGDQQSERLTIYPNPVWETIFLEGLSQEEGPINIFLYNTIGQQWVLPDREIVGTDSWSLTLPVGLPSGQYFLRIMNKSGDRSLPLLIR